MWPARRPALRVLAVPVSLAAAGVAGYTAFLFGQCEGRDLWQSPLLLPTLLAQAVVAGSATYSLLDVVIDVPDAGAVQVTFLAALGGARAPARHRAVVARLARTSSWRPWR